MAHFERSLSWFLEGPFLTYTCFCFLNQAREKYLSLKKGTRTDIATAVEDVSLLWPYWVSFQTLRYGYLLPLNCLWHNQELHSARSSFEQARFNLVHTLFTCHCSWFLIYIVGMPSFVLSVFISRWPHFQISRLRKGLNFWRLLVGQWMLIFVISNKYILAIIFILTLLGYVQTWFKLPLFLFLQGYELLNQMEPYINQVSPLAIHFFSCFFLVL